ncbi:hypothetical protein DICPUDRAFT_79950 [Dictyostelium purpureum]|uniref:RNase III domain-containing protein n=1 Tax=Dictyostelium purpureum TaxID=5786 RepID=F0ZP41_DICPU|nr:uncharacterized protein DICPUDRAFT_79950 [Dictyostelium purpureum]EGC34305.1 hypothetical protein DICPUDRAFT_79950 [Dictyostelium purpureum]|eukprot:XP_003289187.1 hypothetical protein DICPUDRAFT_79950 [Dictyostelium purpureum]
MNTGKTQLNEYIQKRKLPNIVYTSESRGSEHNKDFKTIVIVNNRRIESEWRKNKKDAEKDCATHILEYLLSIEGSPVEFSTPKIQNNFDNQQDTPKTTSSNFSQSKRSIDESSSSITGGSTNSSKRSAINPFPNQSSFIRETPILSLLRENDQIELPPDLPTFSSIGSPLLDETKQQVQQLQIQQQKTELDNLKQQVEELSDKVNRVQNVFQDQISSLQENNSRMERDLYNLKQFVETCSMPLSFVDFFRNSNLNLPKQTQQPSSNNLLPNTFHAAHLVKDAKLDNLTNPDQIQTNTTENTIVNIDSNIDNIDNIDNKIEDGEENNTYSCESDESSSENENQEKEGQNENSDEKENQGDENNKKKKKKKTPKPKRVFLHRHLDYQKIELDFLNTNDDPDHDNIGFFVYNIEISHVLPTNDFTHNNKSYRFSNFLLYTTSVLDFTPTVHIVNHNGDHFAIGLTKGHIQTISKYNFRKIVTFHNFFFSQILGQNYLNFHEIDKYYTVPCVQCLSEPTKPLYDVLMDLLEFDQFPTKEFIDNNVYDENFKEKVNKFYLDKILMTKSGDLSICREIDFNSLIVNTTSNKTNQTSATCVSPQEKIDFSISESEPEQVLPESPIQQSNILINAADEPGLVESIFYLPTLKCSHVSAKISEDFWKLKCILFFDKDGKLENPSRWAEYNKVNTVEPISFISYFKRNKYFQKNPLDVRSLGIPSFIHSIGKLAILPFYSEINWCVRLAQFNTRIVSLKSYKILREAFTHPSTKASNRLIPPSELPMFKDYYPYLGDNQRLEYLGDSVLKLASSIYLFYKYSGSKEGALSMERANNIKNDNLIEVSKRMHLDEILRLSNSDEIKKPHADVIEALFGAISLDRGFEKAYEIIVRYVFNDSNVRLPLYQSSMEETVLSHDLRTLLFNLDLRIDHPSLLEEAFSSGTNVNYQRLEFVGDGVLDYITADYLYKEFPEYNEGTLTEFRSRLVRNNNLSDASKRLKLPPNITDEERAALPPKRLGDYFESLVGCLVLDRGVEETKQFVKKHLHLYKDNPLFILNTILPSNNFTIN